MHPFTGFNMLKREKLWSRMERASWIAGIASTIITLATLVLAFCRNSSPWVSLRIWIRACLSAGMQCFSLQDLHNTTAVRWS